MLKKFVAQITPLPYTGTGEKIFIPHFFYLSQNGVSSLTPFCSDKPIGRKLAHLKLLSIEISAFDCSAVEKLKALSDEPRKTQYISSLW